MKITIEQVKPGDRLVIWYHEWNSPCKEPCLKDKAAGTVEVVVAAVDDDPETTLPFLVAFSAANEDDFRGVSFRMNLAELNLYPGSKTELIGKFGIWIEPDMVKEIVSSVSVSTIAQEGKTCIHCQDHNKYAVANMVNDEFCCFSCRVSEGWRYQDRLLKT